MMMRDDAEDDTAALRKEVRAWLEANWDGSLPPDQDRWNLSPATKAWLVKVFEAGWAVPTWPADWYGRGMTEQRADLIAEEFHQVGAPGARQDRSNFIVRTIYHHADPGLKRKMIPALLKREKGICLLYSEPSAGSDLAGIRTRADIGGTGYLINGQKVWTSGAAFADYALLLARTDWDATKHAGLTVFLFPMRQAGVEVKPLRQITDENHFNEVFLTNARVEATQILGGLNNGWRVLQAALAYERTALGDQSRAARHSAISDDLIGLARQYGRLSDNALRQELAGVIALGKLHALNGARARELRDNNEPSPLVSLGKLAMSRVLHEEARIRTSIVGVETLLCGPDHPLADDANFLAFNAYFTSIGGGTDQIQRNIISERILGLPREPDPDRNIPFRQTRSG
ncbi:MAG TPA: acyl-CoA dehydrogenase family protein [Hyphomicrobium sp.]|nr:acyl-CoA dehydrogenase family protein [Hyphomicrobium sp.]